MKDRAIQVVDNEDEGTILDLKINPVRDDNGKIIQGLIIGNTLEQNKAFMLLAHAGDFKANPTLGVGIEDALLSSNLLEFRHKIREQFTKDGLKISHLDLYDLKQVTIECSYE